MIAFVLVRPYYERPSV
ncbi:MAG: hypothetical protein IKH63_00230 [Prevotella sp.]|nr:hypothetical protein [Prevotella sp.]